MKNISKTIASISLSLLTIGAMAQQLSVASAPKHHAMHIVGKSIHTPPVHGVGQGSNEGYFDYTAWDQVLNTGAYHGGPGEPWPADPINVHYNIHDTVVGGNYNYPTLHSMTVAYDSMWDVNTSTQYGPHDISIQSIDTVWALVGYKNTTGQTDTVIFTGFKTLPNGYPGTTKMFSDTIFVNRDSIYMYGQWNLNSTQYSGGVFGDSLSGLYYIAVTPNYVPTTNPFAVNVAFAGSKLDTFELAYGYPYFSCSPYDYANFSSVGIPLYGINYVNTYTTGWNSANNGVAIQLPESNGGTVSYGVVCGDTGEVYEQDAAIFTEFSYNVTTGVNKINAAGLSVGQNYPNPFNKETQITYSLTKSSDVVFTVYDVTGRAIMSNTYSTVAPGQHIINLNANTFSPGIYFYTFNVNGSIVTKKMVITE